MGACDHFSLPHPLSRVGVRVKVRGQSSMDEITLTRYIKEIGRGKKAAGDLSRGDAQALFSSLLAGRVPDLSRGRVLIALRVKGESLDELGGFVVACEASYVHLPPLANSAISVVFPSYHGARQH